MSSSTLYRIAGLALLLGAVLGIISFVLGAVLFPGNDPSQYSNALYVPVTLVSLIGPLLLVLAAPAMYVRQAKRMGWFGFIGFVLFIIGGFLLTSFTLIPLLVLPWLSQVAPKIAASSGPPSLF